MFRVFFIFNPILLIKTIFTMNLKHAALALVAPLLMNAQEVMTPETLWQMRRISTQGVSPDYSSVIYTTSQTNLETEKSEHKNFLLNTHTTQSVPFDLGKKSFIQWDKN